MTCNYRVLKDKEAYYIIEVYYNYRGRIIGHTGEMSPWGLDPDDLRDELKLMRKACKLPALEMKRGKLRKVK